MTIQTKPDIKVMKITDAKAVPAELQFRCFFAEAFYQIPYEHLGKLPPRDGKGLLKGLIAEDGTIEVAEGVTAIRFRGRPPAPGSEIYFDYEETCVAVISQADYDRSAGVYGHGAYLRSLWRQRHPNEILPEAW